MNPIIKLIILVMVILVLAAIIAFISKKTSNKRFYLLSIILLIPLYFVVLSLNGPIFNKFKTTRHQTNIAISGGDDSIFNDFGNYEKHLSYTIESKTSDLIKEISFYVQTYYENEYIFEVAINGVSYTKTVYLKDKEKIKITFETQEYINKNDSIILFIKDNKNVLKIYKMRIVT